MNDSISSPTGAVSPAQGDVRSLIVARRERMARLVARFTDRSIEQAKEIFRPLPLNGRTMRRVLGAGAAVVALVLMASPTRLAAQSASLGAWGGVFVPLKRDPSLGSIGGTIKRENSFIGGARLTYWGSNILGLEAVAGYTPAKVNVAGSTVNGDRNTQVFVGGVKLMLGLTPSVSPVGFHIGAGPAIVRRGKDVTGQSTSKTDLGAVVGAGLRFPISHGLGIRIDAEDYLYGGDFGGGKDFTNDLVLSAGLHLNFGGK
jgi:hypothetical protein